MSKIYYKRENKYIYFGIAIIALILFFAAIQFVNYYLWVLLIPTVLMFIRGFQIHKNPITAIIKLDEKGLTIINKKLGDKFYDFSNIKNIKMNSNALNGYLKLKDDKKKVILDSVAIKLLDQQEITNFVLKKL